ncbi:MAG TPA: ATP-binding protein [Hanamia sp.]
MKENLYTEFKSSFNDAVIESLVAFANTGGGKVLIGVNNEGMPLKKFYNRRRECSAMAK